MPVLEPDQLAAALATLPGWHVQDGMLQKAFTFDEGFISGIRFVDAVADAADVARALGDVSSSWAWTAMVRAGKATAAQSLQVRTTAAQALVKAVAWAPEAVRDAIAQSLQMAEHPQTQQWLQDAQAGAAPQLKATYGALAGKLQGK